MTNDAKEWVTVKVPKRVRDAASEDPRTYGEVMQTGVTFNVDPRTRERFNDLKAEHTEDGVPEMDADLFLQSLMDTLEAAEDGYYDRGGSDIEEALADAGVALTYDDVKAACEAAIEEQFPEDIRR